jgi:hypothetical protein
MNCHTSEIAIGDYVDGTLTGAAATALEAHLAGCGACRALADDLQAIRRAARRLERYRPPARTWHRIAAAVEEDHRPPAFRWLARGALPAAAMVMLLLGATWLLVRPLADPTQRVEIVEAQDTDAALQAAIAGLERITTADARELDTRTAQVLQANLTVIDAAIGESRAALETQPASDVAQETLFAALNTKLAILQDTVALINEMRNGEEAQP